MAETRVRMDQAAIDRLMRSTTGPAAATLLKAGVKVEGAAKRLCPVDTGRLRSSIAHELTTDARGLVCFVGTNVEYAIYQELGTRYMAAQPYLRPALRSAR